MAAAVETIPPPNLASPMNTKTTPVSQPAPGSHTHTASGSPSQSSLTNSTRTSETLTEKDTANVPRVDNVNGKPITTKKKGSLSKPSSKSQNNPTEPDRSVSPSRLKTFTQAFRYLRNLTPQQVDEFMASYVIYNLDWADEAQMIKTLGPDYQTKVGACLKSYYGVLNHLCALGDVEKMYIPPAMDLKVSVRDNQLLYEESIARDLGLQPGNRVLDLGCGRGRVAAHMTAFAGVKVTGLNIDPNSIAQARAFNDDLGFENEFVVWDFNQLPLPFADASFDAFYNIQAFSLAKDHAALFREISRVLKPGARFSSLDWVKYPSYDETNAEHVELMKRVKPLIGAVGTPTPKSFEEALRQAGFVVTRSDNASVGADGLQSALIDKVDLWFRSVRRVILGLVKVRMLPPHFKVLINRLCLDGQAFVKMDEMRLITTSYRLIAEKPLESGSAVVQSGDA